jgi:hypothetical protein
LEDGAHKGTVKMHDVVEWVPLTGRFLMRRESDHLSLSIKEAAEAVEEEVEKKVVEHVEVLQDYYSSFVSGILYCARMLDICQCLLFSVRGCFS